MKKTIATFCIAASLVVILQAFNFWSLLFLFALVGAIPGTNISLSASTMLQITSLLFGFIFARMAINMRERISLSRQQRA